MQVTVRLLANLRHFNHGEDTITIDLEPTTTIRELLKTLTIPHGEILHVMVGQEPGRAGCQRKTLDESIGQCTEIEIFPSLYGG